MKKNKLKNQKGVTLIETIVSLGILTMGVISALSLITSSLVYSQTVEQKVVVINLAREGMEMVRAIRDFNISSDEGFVYGFSKLTFGKYIVGPNYISGDLQLTVADNDVLSDCQNCALSLYEGRYLHEVAGGTATVFKRMITITDVGSEEKRILSTVYWEERGRGHSFVLEENLTNW